MRPRTLLRVLGGSRGGGLLSGGEVLIIVLNDRDQNSQTRGWIAG